MEVCVRRASELQALSQVIRSPVRSSLLVWLLILFLHLVVRYSGYADGQVEGGGKSG